MARRGERITLAFLEDAVRRKTLIFSSQTKRVPSKQKKWNISLDRIKSTSTTFLYLWGVWQILTIIPFTLSSGRISINFFLRKWTVVSQRRSNFATKYGRWSVKILLKRCILVWGYLVGTLNKLWESAPRRMLSYSKVEESPVWTNGTSFSKGINPNPPSNFIWSIPLLHLVYIALSVYSIIILIQIIHVELCLIYLIVPTPCNAQFPPFFLYSSRKK